MSQITTHEQRFWSVEGRKSGIKSRLWSKDEYERVLRMLQAQDYPASDMKNYKEQRYLRQKYQVYSFAESYFKLQLVCQIFTIDNNAKLIEKLKSDQPANLANVRYVVHDGQLFQSISDVHSMIGHKGTAALTIFIVLLQHTRNCNNASTSKRQVLQRDRRRHQSLCRNMWSIPRKEEQKSRKRCCCEANSFICFRFATTSSNLMQKSEQRDVLLRLTCAIFNLFAMVITSTFYTSSITSPNTPCCDP